MIDGRASWGSVRKKIVIVAYILFTLIFLTSVPVWLAIAISRFLDGDANAGAVALSNVFLFLSSSIFMLVRRGHLALSLHTLYKYVPEKIKPADWHCGVALIVAITIRLFAMYL